MCMMFDFWGFQMCGHNSGKSLQAGFWCVTCPKGRAEWVGHIKCWSTFQETVWVCSKSSWSVSPEWRSLTTHPKSPLPDTRMHTNTNNLYPHEFQQFKHSQDHYKYMHTKWCINGSAERLCGLSFHDWSRQLMSPLLVCMQQGCRLIQDWSFGYCFKRQQWLIFFLSNTLTERKH